MKELDMQFEETGLKSKNNFMKKIKKIINNQVENLYKQDIVNHCTDKLFNEVGNILNNNVKIPLIESQRIKFLKFCENLSEDLNQDKSNQNIKNPEDLINDNLTGIKILVNNKWTDYLKPEEAVEIYKKEVNKIINPVKKRKQKVN